MPIVVYMCRYCNKTFKSIETARRCEDEHKARCPECGVMFGKRIRSQVYCGSQCRERAKEARRRDREIGGSRN